MKALPASAAIDRQIGLRGSFYDFAKMAWPLVEHGRPFVDNWHIGAVCDHLEAVYRKQIKNLVINIPPGCMKPVDEDALVMLADGRRVHLREVVVGDLVVSHKGRARRVDAVHVQGELPTLRIVTESGRCAVAALDHPFLTPRGWIQAGNLLVGDILGQPVPEDRPASPLLTEAFRLAGYFVGDGNTTTTLSSCQANITCLDPSQGIDIEECARALGYTCKYSGKRYNISGGVRSWLKTTGLAGKTSWTKRVPSFVFEASNEQIANFVGAYFACDGTMTRKAPNRADLAITFNSVNRDLLGDIQHLLYRLGIRARVRKHVAKYNSFAKGPYTSWRLTISSQDDTSKFIARVHVRGVKAERLAAWGVARRDFDREMLPDPVVAIEDAGVRPCRCLSVEQDRSFTAEDLAVHNSLTTSVLWDPWCWIQDPGYRFIYGSFDESLVGRRDGTKVLDIVRSKWFQERWGDRVMIKGKEPSISEFYTTKAGMRFATSVGGKVLGRHGNVVVVDDPTKPQTMTTSTLDETWRWKQETTASRLFPDGAFVLIMQRLHDRDMAGRCEEEGGYELLRLPMRFEESQRAHTSIGFVDPRKEEGELLWAEYKTEEAVATQERAMGGAQSAVVAAQLQQRPAPAKGLIFQRDWFRYYVDMPAKFDFVIDSWDLAFKDTDGSDYVVGQRWGRIGAKFYLVMRVRGRWSFPKTVIEMRAFLARADLPKPLAVLVEDKANGPAVLATLGKEVPGFVAVNPEGGKVSRANAVTPLYEAGNVLHPDPAHVVHVDGVPVRPNVWVEEHEGELLKFPKGKNDDSVDAETQALTYLRAKASSFAAAMDQLASGGMGWLP